MKSQPSASTNVESAAGATGGESFAVPQGVGRRKPRRSQGSGRPRVVVISPLPASSNQDPQSGVSAYTASLVPGLAEKADLFVLAQADAECEPLGEAKILPTWTPDHRLPVQVLRALRGLQPDLVHLQHEFNLYGGLTQTGLLNAALLWEHRKGLPVVTTVHGVLDLDDVTPALMARNSLPATTTLARASLRCAYLAIAGGSDSLVVHHEHFRNVLVRAYGIDPCRVSVIPMGYAVPGAQARDPARRDRLQVLVLGFLTGYKLPELVVSLAESQALGDTTFRFCIGRNPRITAPAYVERYEDLARRVEQLGDRARWSGYIPDSELADVFQESDVLVLPYTECVSGSAVAGLAVASGVRVCYSRALRPLFGTGPLEFELREDSLRMALAAAFSGEGTTSGDLFAPWSHAVDRTHELWTRVLGRP